MIGQKLVFGIESSCDDTSVALVRGNKLIDCIVISSAELQAKYGGVVPELASREHEKFLIPLTKEILLRTGIYWNEITHVAYTEKPGLEGCLLVGKVFAKALAFIHGKPLIPVNHVYGHIFSVYLTEDEIRFPCLSLVVSGKTTSLYYITSFTDIELLDFTQDNAVGEVYDKVARELGLGYPGGAAIDRLFNPTLKVPRLLNNNPNPARRFSYSGILSAACRLCKKLENEEMENKEVYVSTIFQRCVVETLISKVKYWSVQKNVDFLTVTGGVAANKFLAEELKKLNIKSVIVDRRFSGDNAAMIALYASYLVK